MDKTGMEELARKITEGTITPAELEKFELWYNALPPDQVEWVSDTSADDIRERIHAGLMEKTRAEAKVVPMRQRPIWWRVAAAVTGLLVLGAVLWIYLAPTNKETMADLPASVRYKDEIAPAMGEVMLKMESGLQLGLDSLSTGDMVSDEKNNDHQLSSVIATRKDDALAYLPTNHEVNYQTISTGKGKDYRLVLSDGTKVWLDAQSSIYFPSSFTGKSREVTVTGQAYFEVAKDATHPFIVSSAHQRVQVLGTHFNVNSFGKTIATTLFEGAVEISTGDEKLRLAPGQQGTNGGGKLLLNHHPDLEEALAWKDGRFYFDGSTVESIMEQIGRWYDIRVVYKDQVSERFVAKVPRNLPLSRLLQLLEMTKQVSFNISGNEITVMRP